jgi:hypothetical protein
MPRMARRAQTLHSGLAFRFARIRNRGFRPVPSPKPPESRMTLATTESAKDGSPAVRSRRRPSHYPRATARFASWARSSPPIQSLARPRSRARYPHPRVATASARSTHSVMIRHPATVQFHHAGRRALCPGAPLQLRPGQHRTPSEYAYDSAYQRRVAVLAVGDPPDCVTENSSSAPVCR